MLTTVLPFIFDYEIQEFHSQILSKDFCNSSFDLNSYTYLLPILLCNLSFGLQFMSAYTELTSALFSVILCAYLIVLVRCFVNESFTLIFFPLIFFRFYYTFPLKACDLNLAVVDCFPSLVGPNRWHLSSSMSTSSSEKLIFDHYIFSFSSYLFDCLMLTCGYVIEYYTSSSLMLVEVSHFL